MDYNIEREKKIFVEIAKHKLNKDFVIDEFSTEIVEEFIKYVYNNYITNSQFMKPTKGLLVAGLPGCGKSLLFKVFREYCILKSSEKRFRICNAGEIVDSYVKQGSNCYNTYLHKQNIFHNGLQESRYINICIDDVGTEQDSVQYYGTQENVLHKLLYGRYELLDLGVITHMITNLDGNLLAERYGQRLYSRFKEMFIYFHYRGPDRRK